MDKLKRAINLAAKIREDSWNEEAGEYSIDLYKAADKAAEQIGFDTQGTLPVFLLLKNSWNEILNWANT